MKMKRTLLSAALMLTLTGAFAAAQDEPITFVSTQFNVVEEAETERDILSAFEGGTVDFVVSEEGPAISLLSAESEAGEGSTDVFGALHGTYPTLVNADVLFDLSDLLAEIETDVDVADAFVELGRMGTSDYQYYIPWMQATYVMAAHKDALASLPEGADLNALTWDQLAAWCAALHESSGSAQCGFPVAGLFHRFLEGYAFPSYTGGMVTGFNSPEAAEMMRFMRDELWPHVNPESINYDFMNEPLLSGEVLVAFDHTARLKPAFDAEPENFVAFPAPAGPAGRGFMPVIAGLSIPFTTNDPDGAEELIKFILSPETQAQVVSRLGFFPVVDGVNMDDLPEGVAIVSAAVQAQSTSPDAIPSLLPVGLGDRGGEINEIFRNAFNRVVVEGEDIQTVLDEEAATLQTLLDETGAACWPPDAPSEGACQVAVAE
jgi:multiple sugar transport system substrate-binding protein